MDDLWAPRAFSTWYRRGLVESYSLKINDPSGNWAVWIRYSFLKPSNHENACGECWFVFSDRRRSGKGRVSGWKETYDFQHCQVSSDQSEVLIESNLLTPYMAVGALETAGVGWNLRFQPDACPNRLLPSVFYSEWMPTTKLTSPVTLGLCNGTIRCAGEVLDADGALISLGHNWGRKHTPRYVWGQARGVVDSEPFFWEGFSLPLAADSTSRGSVTSCVMTVSGRPYRFNSPVSMANNRAEIRRDSWYFHCQGRDGLLEGHMDFTPDSVAALRTIQPDGTVLACLNSMMSSGALSFIPRGGGKRWSVKLANDAALEILTPDLDHGVPVLA